jgi:tetratricopeptide (TPR) repeat protein
MRDRYGLPLTTASPAAVAAHADGVDRLLAAQVGAEVAFARAVEADPDFALARAELARALAVFGRMAEARDAIGHARAAAAGATPRERQHVEAIALALEGRSAEALAAVRAHVGECPRDAVVVSLAIGAFGLISFSGRATHDGELLAFLDGLAPHYAGDDWWFLFAHGWAHTEAGARARGRELMERAFALNARSAHATHGLAHCYFEAGDPAGGAGFVGSWLSGYDRGGPLHCHLAWHQALFELAEGRPERALAVHAAHMRAAVSQSPPLNLLTDGASFLWRLRIYQEAEGRAASPVPWSEVAEVALRSFPRAGGHFADLHCAVAFAAAGDGAALENRLRELRDLEAGGRAPAGPVVRVLTEAVAAFARGDHARAADLMEPVAGEIVRVGGSHAQRELFEDTLLVAWLRSGRLGPARALLAERLARRPSARDTAWLARASA